MSIAGGGPALFRLVRFWSRRWARGVAVDGGGSASAGQHVLTVTAVSACVDTSDGGATVGDVARQLGLDQSGASRMVAAATSAGYVLRGRAVSDARRAVLRLTPQGSRLIESAQQWQQATFEELTESWPEPDRVRFAAYLRRLADQVGA
ncbi:MAG: MarR family winged helix-turn-helix transcriptional regulator [Pseudonocardia sp.]